VRHIYWNRATPIAREKSKGSQEIKGVRSLFETVLQAQIEQADCITHSIAES